MKLNAPQALDENASPQDRINFQIEEIWARCRLFLMLHDMRLELDELSKTISENKKSWENEILRDYFNIKVLQIFSVLFSKNIRYRDDEKQAIMHVFYYALETYHMLFPEQKWQKYFRPANLKALMILTDTWGISYSDEIWNHYFI